MATWEGTYVKNEGYINNIYINTNLSIQEIEKILEKLPYLAGSYYVASNSDNTKYIAIEHYENTSRIYVVINGETTTLYTNSSGWNSFENPILFNDTLVSNINIEGYNLKVGIQNDNISMLISSSEFRKIISVEDIFIDVAKAIRELSGTSEKIVPINFAEKIYSLGIDGVRIDGDNYLWLNSELKALRIYIDNISSTIPIILENGNNEIYLNFEDITIDGGESSSITFKATFVGNVYATNLSSENIKKDVTILGIKGTYDNNTLKKLLDATKSCYYLFYNYNGTSVDDFISYSYTSNVTNMSYMFSDCSNLTTIPQLDTSKVTNMKGMFNHCSNLTTIPQLDTSKVTNIGFMFNGCSNLTSIPQLDTSNASTMEQMFYMCKNLTSIPQLDTSKVTSFNMMFYDCNNLKKIDITAMNKITSVYKSNSFAANCYSLTKVIIRNMTTIPVVNSSIFSNCYHLTGTTNATYNPEGLKDGRIYVPDDKVEELKLATNWSTYADIIVPLSTLEE